MDYYIHPSHKNQGDRENLPHVHVCFGNRSDKSTQVSVSLLDCTAIVAGKKLTYRQQKEVEDYVKSNLSRLRSEWESKGGNDW